MTRIAAIAVILLALSACATRTDLEPAEGMTLPPAPYGLSERLDARTLLEVPTLAVPARSEELRTRSEPREDDPFDLSPE
ncbi:hypothetical protein [Porphyrobacter sp. GA68]|uniref:hypothetical protein n=1 Tax=Porphyrobacter sp. GA68 TaxID=2883480 RepID=UPI001D18D734|nr:hypothetical protein [Porphyrobacter sp. GA68]